ncbi:hypothetical protein FGO68_gene16625 [Halteria grandinella]|uniref:Protein kinase domain-containing protein n=1 Tax=Halteria grandinella TaxID=5974 RepID=A0A8J8NR36_HALGN|nr:hypothetical protein FGO68_gene16625 [Halteria grandinella]
MEPLEQQLVIKHYRTIKKQGEGKHVTVYLAYDESHQRLCTIKLQKVIDDEVKRCKSNQAFIEEISALKRTKHPFIIEMFDYFLWENEDKKLRWCIVMEHADGGNLYDNIIQKKEKVGEKIALNWLAQISLAFAHLTTAGLSNLSLSPHNIFLIGEKQRGTVKLGGLGYLQKDNSIASPERYMSDLVHEQIEGISLQKMFLWSLGIIWYELQTGGEHPFETEFNGGYLTRLPHLDYRPNPAISEEMKVLLKLLLQIKPSERISINELLCHQLIKLKIVGFIEHCFVNEQDIEVLISQTTELFQHNQPPFEMINGQVEEEKQPQAQMIVQPLIQQFEEAKINELIQKIRQDGHGKLADILQHDHQLIQRLKDKQDLNHTVEWKHFEGVKERHGSPDLLPGIYYGQCLEGMRDGYGLIYCLDDEGDPYLIECESNKGLPIKGKMFRILYDYWEKYEGQFDEKYLETCIGNWEHENKSTYHGQYQEGYKHGIGKYSWSCGSSYEGQLKDGDWHGIGKWTYDDGTYSVGEFKEDEKVGVHKFYSKIGVFLREENYDDNDDESEEKDDKEQE